MTDPEKISTAVSQQVALVGSQSLYEKINTNFREGKFEAFFAKEHFDLYRWRVDYFYSQFGQYGDEDICWLTTGFDDSHCVDTVPYQITRNFDEVLALACAPRPTLSRLIFFENDETLSSRARDLYHRYSVIDNLRCRDDYFSGTIAHLTYSDALHVILAAFQNKPLSLKYYAMKKVLKFDMEIKDLPLQLKVKAEEGFFTSSDEIIPFIDEEGRKTLKEVERKFDGDTDGDSDEDSVQ